MQHAGWVICFGVLDSVCAVMEEPSDLYRPRIVLFVNDGNVQDPSLAVSQRDLPDSIIGRVFKDELLATRQHWLLLLESLPMLTAQPLRDRTCLTPLDFAPPLVYGLSVVHNS